MPRHLRDRLEAATESQRKRLGRPPIPAEQRLKQRAARWTDSAWEACERKAQAAGMSTAAWIRKVTEEAEA